MPLEEGQVMVRGLVMGPGTDYIVTAFNPWARLVRADYSGENPYGDGAWSGPEFLEPASIPLVVHPAGNSAAGWQALHWDLVQALRPIKLDPIEPEIHWRNGGSEYMMRARPRALNPEVRNMMTGDVTTSCSLLALDPAIYSSEEFTVSTGSLRRSGGLITPFVTPFNLYSVTIDGSVPVYNGGIENAWLNLRIEGPARNMTITLKTPEGPMSMYLSTVLGEDEWLDISTQDRSVLLNGFVSRLNQMSGTWLYLSPRVENMEIAFNAEDSPDARLSASWRWTY